MPPADLRIIWAFSLIPVIASFTHWLVPNTMSLAAIACLYALHFECGQALNRRSTGGSETGGQSVIERDPRGAIPDRSSRAPAAARLHCGRAWPSLGLAASAWIFRDGDTSWQVAAGEWILRNGRIPTTDPFSFTAQAIRGLRWNGWHRWFTRQHSNSADSPSWAIVSAALVALHAIIFFFLQRRVSTLVLALTLLALDFVLAPFVLARPHVLAWPILAGWTILLLTGLPKRTPAPCMVHLDPGCLDEPSRKFPAGNPHRGGNRPGCADQEQMGDVA